MLVPTGRSYRPQSRPGQRKTGKCFARRRATERSRRDGREGKIVRVSDDPSRERRRTRRLPADGQAMLTREDKDSAHAEEWEAHLLDVSSGGICLEIEHTASKTWEAPDDAFGLQVDEGPLAGVKGKVECRSSEVAENKLILHTEWVRSSSSTQPLPSLARRTEHLGWFAWPNYRCSRSETLDAARRRWQYFALVYLDGCEIRTAAMYSTSSQGADADEPIRWGTSSMRTNSLNTQGRCQGTEEGGAVGEGVHRGASGKG